MRAWRRETEASGMTMRLAPSRPSEAPSAPSAKLRPSSSRASVERTRRVAIRAPLFAPSSVSSRRAAHASIHPQLFPLDAQADAHVARRLDGVAVERHEARAVDDVGE